VVLQLHIPAWQSLGGWLLPTYTMHATEKYLQGLMGPAISEGSFKLTKTIYHLTCLVI